MRTLMLALCAGSALGQPRLDVLPPVPSSGFNIPSAISGDGRVILAAWSPWVWSQSEGWLPLRESSPLNVDFPMATNHDGSIVFGCSEQNNHPPNAGFAQRWTSRTGTPELQGNGRPMPNHRIIGVLDDGNAAISIERGLTYEANAARWTPSVGWQNLPGTAHGLSRDGRLVAGAINNGSAYLWRDSGVITYFSGPSPGRAIGESVTNSGEVFATLWLTPTNTYDVFKWSELSGSTTIFSVPVLPGTLNFSKLKVAEDQRSILARFTAMSGSTSTSATYLWMEGEGPLAPADLFLRMGVSTAGWSNLRLVDMSADGRVIVGYGTLAGTTSIWTLTIPAPASVMLLTMLASGRRRPAREKPAP